MQRFARATVISLTAVFFLLLGVTILIPLVHAADEPSVEAAEVSAPELSIEHMRAEVAAEEDPELRAAMEEQLDLLESGQLDVQTLEQDTARGGGVDGGSVWHQFDDGSTLLPDGSIAPPDGVKGVAVTGGQTEGNYLPPEAQAELEKIFSQGGTGDPSKDGQLREQAEQVMEKYGLERGGMETGGSMREAFEQGGGMEHMAPEAREQMERFMNEREMGSQEMSREGMERETMEREFGGPSSERSYEAPTREYESQTREYEAPTHEYEAPTREYEAPTREYEAPTHEYEAPTREYEAPTHEYEAPTREYEAPTHEYEAPGPGDGSGTGY